MPTFRSRAALGTAAVLAASVVVSGPIAGATVTPMTFMKGVVTNNGVAVANAPVQVLAWPNGDYLSTHNTFNLRIEDNVQTAANGSYALSTDLSILSADYIDPNGAVNLDVLINGSPVAVPAAVAGSSDAAQTELFASASSPAITSLNTATSTMTNQVGSAPAEQFQALQTTSPSALEAQAALSSDAASNACPAKKLATHKGSSEKFDYLYSNTWGHSVISEQIGTSNTLGVGFSASGASWSASGTASITHSSGNGLKSPAAHNFLVYTR